MARTMTITAAALVSALGWLGASPAARAAPDVCASLAGASIPAAKLRLPTGGARITQAVEHPPEGAVGTPDFVPAYCEVRGEILPVDPKANVIHFGVAAPDAWNGEAMQIGGNGMLGFTPWLAALNRDGAGSPAGATARPDAPYPIAQGYATFGDDSGHVSGNGTGPGRPGGVPPTNGQATMGGPPPMGDFGWATNRENWLNFAYEDIRKGHDAAFAVLERLYGKAPAKTYFVGESHGGRQAIEAIGRYGRDYDGALASVPLAYLTELWLYDIRNARAEAQPGGWLSPAKRKVLEAETLRQCDALDGLKDGVVMNYIGCTRALDPVTHPQALGAIRCPDGADSGAACLSDAQIHTVETIRSPLALPYAVVGLEGGLPGAPVGAETSFMAPFSPVAPPPGHAMLRALPMLKPMLGEPDLTADSFDAARLAPKLARLSREMDPPTDWSAFLDHGGKVILHSSADDYLTNPNVQMALYHQVVKTSPEGAKAGLRYYVTPGGDHSSRSYSFPDHTPQPRQMRLVDLLTGWVDHGQAPPMATEQVLMDVSPPYAVTRSRPLCQYPDYPRYLGAGDPKVMASYRCTAP